MPPLPCAEVPRRRVGSLDFSVLPLAAAIDMVVGLGGRSGDEGVCVHFANAYNIALAEVDSAYRESMLSGDLVFSDGMPVVWAGRRLHPDLAASWTRVYGPDVMTGVLAVAGDCRHYLLGGSPETLESLVKAIGERWPQAQLVGWESPAYREPTATELAQRDARIAASGANLVWVGLGTPKQDLEVRRLAKALPITALAVGAAFDFLAGTVPQAPSWMQRSGLEWTYRLMREPRRLAKRYLWGNPRFVLAIARQSLIRGRS